MKGIFKTKGVCAAYIGIALNGDVIEHVEFMGGCHGNLQAVAKLVEGMTVEEAAGRLVGFVLCVFLC